MWYRHSQGKAKSSSASADLVLDHAQKPSGGEPSSRWKERSTLGGDVFIRDAHHSPEHAQIKVVPETPILLEFRYIFPCWNSNIQQKAPPAPAARRTLPSPQSAAALELLLTTATNFHVGNATFFLLLFSYTAVTSLLWLTLWKFVDLPEAHTQHRKISI